MHSLDQARHTPLAGWRRGMAFMLILDRVSRQ